MGKFTLRMLPDPQMFWFDAKAEEKPIECSQPVQVPSASHFFCGEVIDRYLCFLIVGKLDTDFLLGNFPKERTVISLFRMTEKFNLKLLEFPATEKKVSWRDFISIGFAALCDTKWQLHTCVFLYQAEICENHLCSLRP